MTADNLSADNLLEQARDARQRNDEQASASFLRSYLQRGRALLWLAKLTSEPGEALAAAELALQLDPSDEVTLRAVRTARERNGTMSPVDQAEADLAASVVLTTGMTLREARAVIWPFRGINKPIGEALDAGLIRLRDLGWAVERPAGRVQMAARTILFNHIARIEPATLPRPLSVINGSRYAERQERRSLIFAIFAASAGFVVSAAMVMSGIVGMWLNTGLLGWVALAVGLPAARFLERQMRRLKETATSYRLGRWGEERVVENLRALLDDRWTLFRNFTWPNRKGGDIDMILVGPSGVWAFEVKTYSGEIRNVEDRWQRKGKSGWHKLFSHPGKQARYGAKRLKEFLNEQAVDVAFVKPAVIWASSSTDDFEVAGTLLVERPYTPVWKTEDLPDRIERIIQEEPELSSETVNQIIELLSSTVAESRRLELLAEQKSLSRVSQAKAS